MILVIIITNLQNIKIIMFQSLTLFSEQIDVLHNDTFDNLERIIHCHHCHVIIRSVSCSVGILCGAFDSSFRLMNLMRQLLSIGLLGSRTRPNCCSNIPTTWVPTIVCRLVYICINFCYTLGNHDYFLQNTYLSGKNVVAIFSVWSRSHFQHKMYKNMNITRKN